LQRETVRPKLIRGLTSVKGAVICAYK